MIKKIVFFIVITALTVLIALTACNNKTVEPALSLEDKNESSTAETLTEESTELTTEAVAEIKEVSLTFVGDLMVHQWQMDDAYDKKTDTYNFDYTFEPVYKYLQGADLTLGNLETVFAGKEIGYSDYPCFNTPDAFLTAIKKAGFDALTTANNHSMDKGYKGAIKTLELLDKEGLEHFGTYQSQEQRDKPFVKEVNGIKLGFVSATYGVNGNYIPEDKKYVVNLLNEEQITKDIKRAKEEADFVIVMPHLGNEYESYPKEVFVNWIDTMVKAGADAVIASHPHVLQPMELREVTLEDGSVKTAFVAYSMANFVSSQRTIPRDTGVILNLRLKQIDEEKPTLEEVSFVPTWVQWRDTSGAYNIRVLSIFDALTSYEKGENSYLLRQKDYNRIKQAQGETMKAILGGNSANEETLKEKYYILEKREVEDEAIN